MKRAVTLFVVLLSVWLMLPGGMELAENAYHLAAHGDLAHNRNAGHSPFDPEHGCGGGFHLCSCCHFQPSLSENLIEVASGDRLGEGFPPSTLSSRPQDFFSRLEEPPRA